MFIKTSLSLLTHSSPPSSDSCSPSEEAAVNLISHIIWFCQLISFSHCVFLTRLIRWKWRLLSEQHAGFLHKQKGGSELTPLSSTELTKRQERQQNDFCRWVVFKTWPNIVDFHHWSQCFGSMPLILKSYFSSLQQVGPAGMRSPDFLNSQLSFPRPVLLRLVSSEASRLSRTNRLKAITVQEINAAVTLVRKRIRTRAAAWGSESELCKNVIFINFLLTFIIKESVYICYIAFHMMMQSHLTQ